MDDFKLVYIFKALDEIRFRLQALEQNTTPARPAEQKPREWWITDDKRLLKRLASDADQYPGYTLVREVL